MKLYIRSPLEVCHYNIYSKKIHKDIRLAVLADLHNCMCEDNGDRLFHVIEDEKPDLILIAGDLYGGSYGDDPSKVSDLLVRLCEAYPLIYGMGNHERKTIDKKERIIRSGLNEFRSQRLEMKRGLKRAGIRILSNTSRILEEENIKITGLDLPSSYFRHFRYIPLEKGKVEQLIGRLDERYYNILIAHDPSHFGDYSDYGSDLILSGHLHGGVVRLPYLGGVISPNGTIFPKYDAGKFVRKKSTMLVSKGLGMHTIHVRVNDPTELMIVDLWKDTDDE